MNLREKKKFIRSLCESVHADLQEKAKAGKLPEEWDGLELRELIADYFNHERHMSDSSHRADYRRRLREYHNEVLVRNL